MNRNKKVSMDHTIVQILQAHKNLPCADTASYMQTYIDDVFHGEVRKDKDLVPLYYMYMDDATDSVDDNMDRFMKEFSDYLTIRVEEHLLNGKKIPSWMEYIEW